MVTVSAVRSYTWPNVVTHARETVVCTWHHGKVTQSQVSGAVTVVNGQAWEFSTLIPSHWTITHSYPNHSVWVWRCSPTSFPTYFVTIHKMSSHSMWMKRKTAMNSATAHPALHMTQAVGMTQHLGKSVAGYPTMTNILKFMTNFMKFSLHTFMEFTLTSAYFKEI